MAARRLRAAVHTLSDLDLEPDELLARLDDLARCLKGDDSPKMAGGRPWLTPQPRKSAAGTESARRAST